MKTVKQLGVDALSRIFRKAQKINFLNEACDFYKRIKLHEHEEGSPGGYYIDRHVYIWSITLGLKELTIKKQSANVIELKDSSEKIKSMPSHLIIEQKKSEYIHTSAYTTSGHTSQWSDPETEVMFYYLNTEDKKYF
jgi:hypothetical protein